MLLLLSRDTSSNILTGKTRQKFFFFTFEIKKNMTKKMSSKYRQRINIVDYHDDQQIHLPSIELYGKRQQQQQQPQQIFSSPSPLSLLSIDDTKIQSTTMTTATAATKSLNSFLLNQNFHASSSVDNVNISSTATKNGDNEIVDKNSGYNCNGDFYMKKFFIHKVNYNDNDNESIENKTNLQTTTTSPRAIMATKKLLTVSTFPSSSSSSSTNCQTKLQFQSPLPSPLPSTNSSSSSTLQSINCGQYRIAMSIIFILNILLIHHHIDSCKFFFLIFKKLFCC